MSREDISRYDDIKSLPHHRSRKHPPMSMHNRASQFMPFAALTGYETLIAQTAQEKTKSVVKRDAPFDYMEGA